MNCRENSPKECSPNVPPTTKENSQKIPNSLYNKKSILVQGFQPTVVNFVAL